MLIDELIDLKDDIHFQVSGIENLDILIEALNDWPQNPQTIEEYLIQLRTFLHTDVLLLSTIWHAKKETDAQTYGWESESFESLYKFMYTNCAENIEDIFLHLKKLLNKSS